MEDFGYMECGLPEYLQHDLDEFKKNPNDLWWCELYGSINSAEVDGVIPSNQAWYLREKYLGLRKDGSDEDD